MGLFYSPESENGFRDRQEELRKGRAERFSLFQQASKDASERGIEMSPQDFADLTSQLSGAGNELLYRNAFPQGSMLQRYQEHQNRQAQIGKLNQAASLADADKKAQEGFSSLLNGMDLEQDDAQIIAELNKNYPGFMDTGYGKYVPRLGEMKAKIFSNRANEVIAANPGWKNIQTYESLELANDQIDKAAGGSKIVAQKIRDELTSKVSERVRLDINKAFASMKPEEAAQLLSYANEDEQMAVVKGILQRSGVTPKELQKDLELGTGSHIKSMIQNMKQAGPVYLAQASSLGVQQDAAAVLKDYDTTVREPNTNLLLSEVQALSAKPIKEGDVLYNTVQYIGSQFYVDDRQVKGLAQALVKAAEAPNSSPTSIRQALTAQFGPDAMIPHTTKKSSLVSTRTQARVGDFQPGADLPSSLDAMYNKFAKDWAHKKFARITQLEQAPPSAIKEVEAKRQAEITNQKLELESGIELAIADARKGAYARPNIFKNPDGKLSINDELSRFEQKMRALKNGPVEKDGQSGQQSQNNAAPQQQPQQQTQVYSLEAAGYKPTSSPALTEMANKRIAADPALKARHDALVASAATALQLAQTQQQQQPQQSGSGRFPSGPSYKHQYEQALMQLIAFRRAAVASSYPGYVPGRSAIVGNP